MGNIDKSLEITLVDIIHYFTDETAPLTRREEFLFDDSDIVERLTYADNIPKELAGVVNGFIRQQENDFYGDKGSGSVTYEIVHHTMRRMYTDRILKILGADIVSYEKASLFLNKEAIKQDIDLLEGPDKLSPKALTVVLKALYTFTTYLIKDAVNPLDFNKIIEKDKEDDE